jgi:hypothetical protein
MRGHEGGRGAFGFPRFIPAPTLIAANPGQNDEKRSQDKAAIARPKLAGAFGAEVFRNLIKNIGQGGPRSENRPVQG